MWCYHSHPSRAMKVDNLSAEYQAKNERRTLATCARFGAGAAIRAIQGALATETCGPRRFLLWSTGWSHSRRHQPPEHAVSTAGEKSYIYRTGRDGCRSCNSLLRSRQSVTAHRVRCGDSVQIDFPCPHGEGVQRMACRSPACHAVQRLDFSRMGLGRNSPFFGGCLSRILRTVSAPQRPMNAISLLASRKFQSFEVRRIKSV